MKFIHSADLHLGARPDFGKPWSEEREKEIWSSFEKLVQEVRSQQIDLLLLAGDLFHGQPLMRELKEMNYLFSTLTGTRVVCIAGNHDHIKTGSNYQKIAWSENVVFLTGTEWESVWLKELNTEVVGCSYDRKEITRPMTERMPGVRGHGGNRILIAHGGDEKHRPFRVSDLERSDYDYIALGHIHKPQILVKGKAAYAGALEPIDINDTGRHGYIAGEIRDGVTRLSFVPFASRTYIHLEVKTDKSTTELALVQTVKKSIEKLGRKNIYKLILKGNHDPDIIFDPDHLVTAGNIAAVENLTAPDYDFGKLKKKYKDQFIEKYITRMEELEDSTERQKALYYGIKSILEAKKD